MTFSSDPGNPVPFVACDPNISAGPETTCAFAENVFLAYYHAWKAQGAAPVTQAQAFSPKTNRTYRVICATGSPGTGGAGSGGTATTGGAGSGGAGSGGTATTGGTAPSGGSSVTGGSQPNAATEVSCSTTEGALITFPLAAVVAYKPQ
jgi:hypothetical protein